MEKPIIFILVILIMIAAAAFFVYKPAILQTSICSVKSDCVLAFTGDSPCGGCDLSANEYKCVTKEEADRMDEIRNQKYEHVACATCYPSPKLYRCECQNGNCIKTDSCVSDAECYSYMYQCISNECTLNQEVVS